MAQKITEFCNRVAYVEASYYHGWSSRGECRVVEFEAITTDGKIITTTIKGDDVNKAIKAFVDANFPCDKYFFTEKDYKYSHKTDRYGGYERETYTFFLHTVTVL